MMSPLRGYHAAKSAILSRMNEKGLKKLRHFAWVFKIIVYLALALILLLLLRPASASDPSAILAP